MKDDVLSCESMNYKREISKINGVCFKTIFSSLFTIPDKLFQGLKSIVQIFSREVFDTSPLWLGCRLPILWLRFY